MNIVTGNDLVLHDLGLKLSHDHELTNPERAMAISMAAQDIKEFHVDKMPLPEIAKQALLDAIA